MTLHFICCCGKEFNSQKSLSAHQANCKNYYLLRDGNIDKLISRNKHLSETSIKRGEEIKRKRREEWNSVKHYCENCGKELPKDLKDVYGSGRFCSRPCANSRTHSDETKNKIREAALSNPTGWASKEWLSNHPEFFENQMQNHSKRELEIVNYLKKTYPNDEWKQGFVKNYRYENDFINPDVHSDKLKVVIEYDGVWHFKDIHGQLEAKQKKDRLTLKWCKEYGYRLIRIDEDLDVSMDEIINAIYNSDADVELFGSSRYDYLFEQ